MNSIVSLSVHEWLNLCPPDSRGGLATQMALALAASHDRNKRNLQLFVNLLDWGVKVSTCELAKVNCRAEFIDAVASKQPTVFALEEALRGGVEFSHEPTLKAVAVHMPKADQERWVKENFWTWVQWRPFVGLEKCEDILKLRPDLEWFGDATAGEDFLIALTAAREEGSERWVDRVLNHVGYDLELLMPIRSVHIEERAELERFVLGHRNRHAAQSTKQIAQAL
jgi:hypothetical protein